jgi:hypothetical protein
MEKFLARVIITWQMVCPKEALLLVVVFVSCHEGVISLSFLESEVIAK